MRADITATSICTVMLTVQEIVREAYSFWEVSCVC